MQHILRVSPSRPRGGDDRQWPGRFDAFHDDHLLVERSRAPFCDGARALLAQGLADPGDRLVMRYAESDTDALAAKVGVAAGLTVREETKDGKPRITPWKPMPLRSVPVAPPMRENIEAVV
jgi:hypothetical protein